MEFNSTEREYIRRINSVIDYIESNYSENLSLELLADLAHFSKFHFHRIFYSVIGETLFGFIQRIRLEKAAAQLLSYKDKPIGEIAYDCGFSSSSAFARSFKEFFGSSASEWREIACRENSNLSKMIGNIGNTKGNINQEIVTAPNYFCDVNNVSNLKWRCKMFNQSEVSVEIKELQEFVVAYIRHIGRYKGDPELFEALFGRLFSWAGPRGLIRFPETKILSVYYDNPEITDDKNLRLDACISIPDDTSVSGEVGKMKISQGKYAAAKFEINQDEYGEAWNFLMGVWLPRSGFQCDDKPCFELYLNNPKEHPENKHIVEIYIPVKPL